LAVMLITRVIYCTLFYDPRDAMHLVHGICCYKVFVHPSSVYCVKTAYLVVEVISPCDSQTS